MFHVHCVRPGEEPQAIAIDGECPIGRGPNNRLVIPDKSVSTNHAVLRVRDGNLFLVDLKSTNGTFVDGRRIAGETPVTAASRIAVGAVPLRVAESTPAVPEDAPPAYNAFQYIRPFLEPIQKHLDDDSVTEIMVNGPQTIFVERGGRIQPVSETFGSLKALTAAAKNVGRAIGRELSEQRPILDARLEDGSRVAVVIAPCALDGAAIAIRKFFKRKLTFDQLVTFGSISREAVEVLSAIVLLKLNLIVSGGTGSGKTSMLNAISNLIPDGERVVVIEDSAELQLQKENLVRLEARPADDKGRYEVSIRDLLRATLRLRPDRIVIGEVRGGEAFDLLQAMNTGHGGSMSTIHSNSPLDTLARLENTAIQSNVNIPLIAIKQQIASTINVVVHVSRMRDGTRKVTHVTEICGLDADGNYRLTPLFTFKARLTADGRVAGEHLFSGAAPSFLDELLLSGIPVPSALAGVVAGLRKRS